MKHTYIMLKYILLLTVPLMVCSSAGAQVSLSGKITESKNHSKLAGAIVYIADLNTSAASDSLGNYILRNIPAGAYLVQISFTGYETKIETVNIKGAAKESFMLDPSTTQLNEVIVTGVAVATEKEKAP